jgi:nicotinate-nucleotide adenylyltransferase
MRHSDFHERMATRGMRIGLLGGSFNPAHEGHLHISTTALKRLELHEIWWLVSPQNPLKSANDMAPLTNRLHNARAVATHPKIWVTDLETRLATQYTCDTLKTLRLRNPGAQFVWIMGADNLKEFPLWKRWTEIMNTVPIAVIDRPGYSMRAQLGQVSERFGRWRLDEADAAALPTMRAPAWVVVHTRLSPVSGTDLRRNAV